MHRRHEEVRVLPESDQTEAIERAPGQIEWPLRLRGGQSQAFGLSVGGGQTLDIRHRQFQRPTRTYDLDGLPVDAREDRPQGLVPPHDLLQASLKRHVQGAVDLEGRVDVVRRVIRYELIDEPEPELGERDRELIAPRHRDDRPRGALPAGSARDPMCSASRAIVGLWNRAWRGNSRPSSSRTREATWTARSELPPSSKRSSRTPTWGVPRTTHRSTPAVARGRSGAGRARRLDLNGGPPQRVDRGPPPPIRSSASRGAVPGCTCSANRTGRAGPGPPRRRRAAVRSPSCNRRTGFARPGGRPPGTGGSTGCLHRAR